MSLIRDIVAIVLISGGGAFFLAGTIGLIRFPDMFTRLHAMAKADNVGLGLVVLGLMVQVDSLRTAAQLLLVWLLVLLSSACSAHLLARDALRRGLEPWTRP
ncbi:MAG: monovalent cation/H(+) antiporter subunit G [Pseudomonadota bacterium]